jgi:hypothetical protein
MQESVVATISLALLSVVARQAGQVSVNNRLRLLLEFETCCHHLSDIMAAGLTHFRLFWLHSTCGIGQSSWFICLSNLRLVLVVFHLF